MSTSLDSAAPPELGTRQSGGRARTVLRSMAAYPPMLLLAAFFAFPIVFMVVTSLKVDETQVLRDVNTMRAFLPVGDLGLGNYADVFERQNFGRFAFNSVVIVTATVFMGLVVNSLAAYALARLQWRGRAVMLSIVVALIIIPFEAVAIPLLVLVNEFGWLDSYRVQVFPFVADAFSIYLFYQFFIGLPIDLEEAALVDGAGRLRIFWSIVVPLSKPVFATVAILQFLFRWGDYLWPLMVTRGERVRPLMIGMQQFFGQYPREWGDIMAFAAMITVPVLVVFLLFQRWFVQSVASTGIKGG